MRRPKSSVSAVAEFSCSAAVVWQTLIREQSYRSWFGYPKTEELVFVDPCFSIGAKLNFKGFSTSIITAFIPERELTFSDSNYQVSFFLDPIPDGVSVTIAFNTYTEGRHEGIDKRRFCTETLRALKRSVGVQRYAVQTESQEIVSSRLSFKEFTHRVFSGYRRPVLGKDENETEEIYSSLLDNTEASVAISRRALLFTVLLILMFFVSINISLSFERSDIVPSSGLSLLESDQVDKYHSSLIRVGDKKRDLELMLSCQGLRQTPTPTVEFLYNSLAQTGSLANEQIIVLYDAYGEVRRFAYIDNIRAAASLYRDPPDKKLTVGREYYELLNFDAGLSSSMNVYEVEAVVGVPLSAYVVDRNGEITIFFGKLICDDIFSTNYRSQIMVSLDPSTGATSVEFYKQIDDSNAPYPLDELSKTLKRQYAGLDEYLSDRFAFERSFLLFQATEEQLSILLDADGRPFADTDETEDTAEEADDTADGNEEDISEDIFETYLYTVRNASDTSSETPRYRYLIDYKNGVAESVRFTNRKLISYSSSTLSHLDQNSFHIGMRYGSAAEIAGILPTSLLLNGDVIVLGYGNAIVDEETEEESLTYELTLTFSQTDGRLIEYTFYQETDGEVSG